MNEQPQIVMFGGAFNPPHLGHRQCVEAVLTAFPEAKVVVMPGKVPASRAGVGKDVGTEFSMRLAMCQLAFSQIDQQRVSVSALEADLPSPNYTINTLRQLKKAYPDQRIAILIGHDNFAKFASWQDPLPLFENADVLVAGRASLAGATSLRQMADNVLVELGIKPTWGAGGNKASLPGYEHSLFLLPEVAHPAESSKLRTQQPQQRLQWLEPSVLNYIKENSLYPEGVR